MGSFCHNFDFHRGLIAANAGLNVTQKYITCLVTSNCGFEGPVRAWEAPRKLNVTRGLYNHMSYFIRKKRTLDEEALDIVIFVLFAVVQ